MTGKCRLCFGADVIYLVFSAFWVGTSLGFKTEPVYSISNPLYVPHLQYTAIYRTYLLVKHEKSTQPNMRF